MKGLQKGARLCKAGQYFPIAGDTVWEVCKMSDQKANLQSCSPCVFESVDDFEVTLERSRLLENKTVFYASCGYSVGRL